MELILQNNAEQDLDCYIAVYAHRHGYDYLFYASNGIVTEEMVIERLDDWEPHRGETVKVLGPEFSLKEFIEKDVGSWFWFAYDVLDGSHRLYLEGSEPNYDDYMSDLGYEGEDEDDEFDDDSPIVEFFGVDVPESIREYVGRLTEKHALESRVSRGHSQEEGFGV